MKQRLAIAIALSCMVGVIGCGNGDETAPPPSQPAPEETSPREGSRTRTSIRNAHLHVKEGVVLQIENLIGEIEGTRDDAPATFDDPESFLIDIDSATVFMAPSSLAALLNTHVFAVPDAPIAKMEVTIEEGKLKQKGVLKKGVEVAFETEGQIRATPEGDILVHTTSLKAAGLPVKGLLDFFGVEMEELIESERARGLRVEGDDLILDPEEALPPPRVKGRITEARIEGSAIRLDFGDPREAERELKPEGKEARNYLFFRGGALRFGKLTMRDSDLRLVDADADDPFDFSLPQYNRHLVAGYSKNSSDYGLVVQMPDLGDIDETTDLRPGR
ncbi:MAG: hypothetical protein ACRD21_21580 [Vicinamibacteria bacterium]